ncbi:PREDICTED: uncharacterized protein LOC108571252 [Habropoda laboriosa]|uniref:uncharacterized protein LOC108571252 n=1 Tax=Habropoda laboriosa TaxID=597456 RepID=UPI00083D8779|nr:PREDICTED: uncharacterized protein LOC108571252 [Habropoda laboriosa]
MAILRPAFNILTICGCWRPCSCRTTRAKAAYIVYTMFVVLLLHSFCISQFFNVILNLRTADELSESFYMFIASVLSCCKIVTLLTNHGSIEILRRRLEEEPCKPVSAEEAVIQSKFDRNIGSVTIYYTILVELTVLCMILSSLLGDFNERELAYRAWLPFDYSLPTYYYIAYVHQIVALIGTSLSNVACDVIICGLLVHACGQQEILKHRMKEMTQEQRPNIGKIVRFHDYLYGYVFTMQEKFRWIIGVQLLSSTLVVCFILYELANTPPISSKYLQFVLYLACMMTQIFFYCWYGEQLKLKSVEIVRTIFEMDWIPLQNGIKKDLIVVARRAMIPIELTCAYMFTMDLNTFVSLLKMSYSTYNLLERRSDKEERRGRMDTLSWTFKLLTVNGILAPSAFMSQWQTILYGMYMFFMVSMLYAMECCLILGMIFNVDSQEDFSENLYITLILMCSCCKIYMLVTSAKGIKVMVDVLREEPFVPMNREENEIRVRFEEKIESNWNAKAYTYFLDILVVVLWITSYFTDYRRRKFKFRVWLPYDTTTQPVFTLIYCQQIVCTWYSVNINVICDCLFSGLMIQICSILRKMKPTRRNLNEKLGNVSSIQFAISTGAICFNLYRMSVIELGPKFVEALTITSLEIVDRVTNSNITVSDESSKKILVLMIRRALEPVEFTGLRIMSVNLESFTSLLKSSYAAFNMLQERREDQIMDLIVNVTTQDEFSDNFYILLACAISLQKAQSVLNSRKNVHRMIDLLNSEPFHPECKEEIEIRSRISEHARRSSTYYAILVESTVMTLSFGALLKPESRPLPYRIWLPCNYTPLITYCSIYTLQCVALALSAMMHVACDSLICGLLLHTYGQIEILGCRLKTIKENESKTSKLCVRYNNLIYRFTAMINEQFEMAIFTQFAVSTLAICFNLYLLTGSDVTPIRYVEIIMYSSCMLTQIFIYCWYGNEVKLKSLEISNMIFHLDWTPFDKATKRNILTMMMRASSPIEIISVRVLSVNLDSFVALLKTSYSAYNVLQRGEG